MLQLVAFRWGENDLILSSAGFSLREFSPCKDQTPQAEARATQITARRTPGVRCRGCRL